MENVCVWPKVEWGKLKKSASLIACKHLIMSAFVSHFANVLPFSL